MIALSRKAVQTVIFVIVAVSGVLAALAGGLVVRRAESEKARTLTAQASMLIGSQAPAFYGVIGDDTLHLPQPVDRQAVFLIISSNCSACDRAVKELGAFARAKPDVDFFVGMPGQIVQVQADKRSRLKIIGIVDPQAIIDRYQISALPYWVSIDKQGIIADVQVGFTSDFSLEAFLRGPGHRLRK